MRARHLLLSSLGAATLGGCRIPARAPNRFSIVGNDEKVS